MIRFDVHGVPIPKGSMRAMMRPGMKFPVVFADNKRTKPWETTIRKAATAAGCRQTTGPIVVVVEFHMPRPKAHFGARGLKPKAPLEHTVKPDVDKLARALLDGLKGTAFVDDAQVVSVIATKRYASRDEVPGAVVELREPGEAHRRLTSGETASLFGEVEPETSEERQRG